MRTLDLVEQMCGAFMNTSLGHKVWHVTFCPGPAVVVGDILRTRLEGEGRIEERGFSGGRELGPVVGLRQEPLREGCQKPGWAGNLKKS